MIKLRESSGLNKRTKPGVHGGPEERLCEWEVMGRVSHPCWPWDFLLVHMPLEGTDLAGLNRPLPGLEALCSVS